MTERHGLYIMVFAGLVTTCSVKDISEQNRQILERISNQSTIQTANVLGDSLPERFYVVNGDTIYQEIDRISVRDYFNRSRTSTNPSNRIR
jgi:hypothetical protein